MNRTHLMFLHIGWLALLLIATLSLQAQPKPKRDKSKDRVAVVPQKLLKRISITQTDAQAKPSSSTRNTKTRKEVSSRKKAHHSKIRKSNVGRKRYRKNIRNATYLTVDYSDSPVRSVTCNSGNIELSVNTDGSQWFVRNVGSWYRVYRDWEKNTISIFYDSNSSHDTREDWFDVYSGNVTVRVRIIQEGLPMEASAVIQGVVLTHETYYASNKSLKADVSFSIRGAKGQICFVVALIKDVNGNYLNTPYEFKEYSAGDRLMIMSQQAVIPSSNSESYYRIPVYIPNNAIQIYNKRKTLLYLELKVFSLDKKEFISDSYWMGFKARKKKYNIETFDL